MKIAVILCFVMMMAYAVAAKDRSKRFTSY